MAVDLGFEDPPEQLTGWYWQQKFAWLPVRTVEGEWEWLTQINVRLEDRFAVDSVGESGVKTSKYYYTDLQKAEFVLARE